MINTIITKCSVRNCSKVFKHLYTFNPQKPYELDTERMRNPDPALEPMLLTTTSGEHMLLIKREETRASPILKRASPSELEGSLCCPPKEAWGSGSGQPQRTRRKAPVTSSSVCVLKIPKVCENFTHKHDSTLGICGIGSPTGAVTQASLQKLGASSVNPEWSTRRVPREA